MLSKEAWLVAHDDLQEGLIFAECHDDGIALRHVAEGFLGPPCLWAQNAIALWGGRAGEDDFSSNQAQQI